jgi:hypothetical protein
MMEEWVDIDQHGGSLEQGLKGEELGGEKMRHDCLIDMESPL